MKLITLNIWGGKVFDPLITFLKRHAIDTDIFCFQEVLFGASAETTPLHKGRLNIFEEIQKELPEFNSYSFKSPSKYFQHDFLNGIKMGQAIFLKKPLKNNGYGGFKTYKGDTVNGMEFGGYATGSFQWIELENNTIIGNLHGIWQKNSHKLDTPERLEQSKIIKEFLADKSNSQILCGDFNLAPETESLNILETNARDLIAQYKIDSTRSSYYEKSIRFSDYILISPSIEVKNFKVLQDEVSDHLPLMLEFD